MMYLYSEVNRIMTKRQSKNGFYSAFQRGFSVVLFAAVFILPSSVLAQHEASIAKADSAYMAGEYEAAISGYEQVLAQGQVSPSLYFNLGNALFKAKRIAPSILNYERALKLAPQDEDIRFNLKLASMTTIDRIEQMPVLFISRWHDAFMQALPMDMWAWSCVLAFLLVFIGLAIFRISDNEGMRKALFYTAMVLLIWGILSGYAAQQQYHKLTQDDRAVVFEPTLNVKSAPEQTGKDLFVIHEGLVVQITEEIGDWYRIQLSDGNVGWVPKSALEVI
jgi:tetratricopeptide (TPR) repeat protein